MSNNKIRKLCLCSLSLLPCHKPRTPLPLEFLHWPLFQAYRVNEELRAVEADTSHNLHRLGKKVHIENGLGQFDVSKMAGTLRAIPRTSQATGEAIDGSLSRIHEAV